MERPARKYNLGELYGHESSFQRYTRLTVGEGAGIWSLIWHEVVLGICTGAPGLIGLGLRHAVFPLVFQGVHRKSYLGRHVLLRCPRQIKLSSGTVVDDFAQLIATSRKPEAIVIGENSFVRSFAMINAGPPDGFIRIGRNSGVGQGTLLYGNGGLVIGDNVMIAGQCSIIASSHNYENPNIPMTDQGYSAKGITIENNVWIGAGAKILDGISIGEGAIVGANAVVTRSVAAGARVGGVPARELHNKNSAAD